MARRTVIPVLDVKTGKQYRSKSEAGRKLAHLVKGDPNDNFVFFKIQKALPDRFRFRNADGDWVTLDDPSAPVGTLRGDPDAEEAGAPTTRLTTVELDEAKLRAAQAILRTSTLRDTVDRAFDEVIARDARARSIAQLQSMEGLDLDKPAVMQKAWR